MISQTLCLHRLIKTRPTCRPSPHLLPPDCYQDLQAVLTPTLVSCLRPQRACQRASLPLTSSPMARIQRPMYHLPDTGGGGTMLSLSRMRTTPTGSLGQVRLSRAKLASRRASPGSYREPARPAWPACGTAKRRPLSASWRGSASGRAGMLAGGAVLST